MKILLVRLRLIGDVVFTTPLVRALRGRFPEAHLTYLVEPPAAPVLRGNPHLDEVLIVPRRHGWRRLQDDLAMARRLRRRHFDLAIDLHGGPRSAWFTWASRARRRIGYTIAGRSWMYTDVVPRAADLAARHSVLNQSDLLAPLGIPPCDPLREPVEMADDDQVRGRVAARLDAAGIKADDPLVLIHVSAGNPFRRWPPESFAALTAALVRRDPRRRIVLVSGPSERLAAAWVAAEARAVLGPHAHAVTADEYDLAEVRALAARAAVYIGGDSGPLHVAATTRTPIVALLGPTLGERSGPWRDPALFAEIVDSGPLSCRPCDQRRCVTGDYRCLSGISAARVEAAAERALSHSREMQHA